MDSETKENEKAVKVQNNQNQEIIDEILSMRSKQQRKSWFGQDNVKEPTHKSAAELSNAEMIVEEDHPIEKK